MEWFVQQLCQELISLGKDPYKVLNREASKIANGSEGLFFLPYLAGERTPHADPLARGAFVGLTLKHSRGHMARAIMEGVTFALRDSLAIMKEMGVPVKQIRAGGGGAKSKLWRQLQADIFGQSVYTINAEQGPAFGRSAAGSSRRRRVQEYRRSMFSDDPDRY